MPMSAALHTPSTQRVAALSRLERAARDAMALLDAEGAAIALVGERGDLALAALAGAPGPRGWLLAAAWTAAGVKAPARPQLLEDRTEAPLLACAFDYGLEDAEEARIGVLLARLAPGASLAQVMERARFAAEAVASAASLALASEALSAARQELAERTNELTFTAQMADIGVWSYNVVEKSLNVSPELFEILDETGDAPMTRRRCESYLVDLEGEEGRQELRQAFADAIENGAPFDLEKRISTARGVEKWVRLIGRPVTEQGRVVALRGCVQDVTEHVLTREDITLLATRDYLTEVANRASFTNLFEAAVKACDFARNALVLFIIDVDHFKNINDSFGHDVGDQVLREVTQILYAAVRDSDVVGRLGGDEFGVFVVGPRGTDGSGLSLGDRVAQRIQELIGERDSLRRLGGGVTLSIGYAEAPGPEASFKTTLKSADLALYDAKRAGRNRAICYRDDLGDEYENRERVLIEVDRALKLEQFEPHYQLKLALSTGCLAGFEALARWRHPERGVLSPGAFAEALDDVRLSTRISEFILHRAVEDASRLRKMGLRFGRIGINITEKQIADPGFADRLEEVAATAGVECSDFDIEITEDVLLARNVNDIRATLRKLQALNVTLSLDDFGTGYASLTHLRAFPIDQIKIDKSFILDIESNRESRIITNAVIRMAHDLQLSIIAEGVETAAAEAILRDMGCDLAQGFYYSRPVPFFDAARICASRQPGALHNSVVCS